ncbi:MAG: thioredoxin-disulfide reductase [Desulfovibrionales bacterium]
MKSIDALVIGGGPAGMTAALYLLRAGVSVAQVEKLAPGGQVLMTEWIDNYPGFPKGIRGYELADLFAAHLDGFTLDRYTEDVRAIEPAPGNNRVQIGDEWIIAKSIVICSGAKYRNLNVPGEAKLAGKGVSYCAICDGQFFRDQVVACIGGGDTALEEATYLTKLVKKLYLIHRRDTFRGAKVYQDKVMADPKIERIMDTKVTEILGDTGITGVRIQNVKTKATSVLTVDGAFIFVGITPQVDFLPSELTRDPGGFIVTDANMKTNLPGIFAAGDVRSKICRQVTTAVGDGATAAYSAGQFLEQHHA